MMDLFSECSSRLTDYRDFVMNVILKKPEKREENDELILVPRSVFNGIGERISFETRDFIEDDTEERVKGA